MTDRIDEFDRTSLTTGLGNWAKQRRDAAIAHLTRNTAAGGKALGRSNARLVANRLYRGFNEYLARGGQRQANAATLSAFIQRNWPSTIPQLSQDFPDIFIPPPAAPQPQAASSPAAPAAPAAVAPSVSTPAPVPASVPAVATPAPVPADFDQQLKDIGQKIVARVREIGAKRAANDSVIRDLEAEQNRLRAQSQQENRSRKGNRLVEADPSLSIPTPPSVIAGAPLTFGRKGVAGTPPTGPAQAGTPPAFLQRQRSITGSGTLSRAQIDRVLYALAYLLMDSGHASVQPSDSAIKPGQTSVQSSQPRSAAGQAMASGRGFGPASAMKTMQMPLNAASITQSQGGAPATARISPEDLAKIDGLLAGKSMPLSQLINSMGVMNPQTVQGLLLAAGIS